MSRCWDWEKLLFTAKVNDIKNLYFSVVNLYKTNLVRYQLFFSITEENQNKINLEILTRQTEASVFLQNSNP